MKNKHYRNFLIVLSVKLSNHLVITYFVGNESRNTRITFCFSFLTIPGIFFTKQLNVVKKRPPNRNFYNRITLHDNRNVELHHFLLLHRLSRQQSCSQRSSTFGHSEAEQRERHQHVRTLRKLDSRDFLHRLHRTLDHSVRHRVAERVFFNFQRC